MVSQVTGEAAVAAWMWKAAGEDTIATCHVSRVMHQLTQVFVVPLPVWHNAADRHT